MASNLNEISHILTGDNNKTTKQASTVGMTTPGKPITQALGLNQLSDAAEKIEVKVDRINTTNAPNVNPALPQPTQLSQETLIDAAQQLQFQQPSQPEIPPPVLPESQGSQPVQIGEDGKPLLPGNLAIANDPNMLTQLNLLGPAMTLEALNIGNIYPYLGSLGSQEEEPHTTGGGNRSKGKKQTRRGPMDEMRQLIRILVKVFPHSAQLIGNTDEAGGGNRISEEQIKNYLERAMGEAPRPGWGVPTGWYGYLAELFSWATGRVITGEEAKHVARREPGRSWEALEDELHNLGVHPSCWPLPLTLAGIHEAEKKPIPMPVPSMPNRRGGDGAASGAPSTSAAKRSRSSLSEKDFNKLDEADLWKAICDALTVAGNKAGTGMDQSAIQNTKTLAKLKMDDLMGGSLALMNSYLPILGTLEGNPNIFSNLMQTLPLDDGTAAAIAAMATGGIEGMPPVGSAMPVMPTSMDAAGNSLGGEDGPAAKKAKREDDGTVEDASGAGGEGEDPTSKAAAAAAAAGGQLGTLPMQPPPLNVNFNNALAATTMPYIMPGFNLGSLGGLAGGVAGSGGGGVEGGDAAGGGNEIANGTDQAAAE